MSKGYVLITPARNEEAHIARVLDAVTAQTVPPSKYVVVSDGSTDLTDNIVEDYVRKFGFIELVRSIRKANAGFGSKVIAFNAGYTQMKGIDYSFIGNLDADISFDANYFGRILEAFDCDEKLGLAGGLVYELYRGKFLAQRISANSVAGPVQLFRRKCFEEIGGYIPMDRGGIDAAAEVMARMHGWHVRTIRSCKVLAHRPVHTGRGSVLGQRFNKGVMNYLLGYHLLFQSAIVIGRLFDRPLLIGAILTLAGYLWTAMDRPKREVNPEFVQFLRKEQMQRLFDLGEIKRFLRKPQHKG